MHWSLDAAEGALNPIPHEERKEGEEEEEEEKFTPATLPGYLTLAEDLHLMLLCLYSPTLKSGFKKH